MQTDFRAIQAIAQTPAGAMILGSLIEKTDKLFQNVEAPALAELMSDLLYYAGNPERADELTKDDFVQLTGHSMMLVQMLTNLRGEFNEFTQYLQRHE